MLQRKILSLFESEIMFSRKIILERKKQIIVIDLCPVTCKSFVVKWSAKIASRWLQLKPLHIKRHFVLVQ